MTVQGLGFGDCIPFGYSFVMDGVARITAFPLGI
jgi:hypothetical protein